MTIGSFTLIFVIMLSAIVFADDTRPRIDFFNVTKLTAVTYGEVLGTYRSRSKVDCARECSGSQQCRSAVYDAGEQTCTTNKYFLEPSPFASCDLHNNCSSGSWVQYARKNIKTTMRYACLDDNDCMDPGSECRLNTCYCLPGLSYNPSTYECVSACAVYGTTFQPDLGRKIDGYNVKITSGLTKEECLTACTSQISFVCKSIDFCSSCYMNNITALERPDLYVESRYCDFYTRDCE